MKTVTTTVKYNDCSGDWHRSGIRAVIGLSIRGRVIWPVIGISLAFGRSSKDEQAQLGKLMGSTHEGIHKQGWQGVIHKFSSGNERKSVSR